MGANEREVPRLRQKKFQEMDLLFHPDSIAVVGVSEERLSTGASYLLGLLRAGFKGKVFAVGRNSGNMAGLPIYRSVREVPGEVDYVSVFIPREEVLALLEECRGKGVKGMQLFTAGFSELDEEGRKLEQELVNKARHLGIRLIGPNCTGLSCTKQRIALGPLGFFGEEGNVAFLSQSGGFGAVIYDYGSFLRLRFSKVISFGNAADLDAVDFLEYLLLDPDTQIIGAYFEGAKRNREFLAVLKEVAKKKPLVIWKGGKTKEGRETAFSHTASLSSAPWIWSSLIKQVGAVEVESMEEMAATLLAFQNLPPLRGRKAVVIAGLVGAGGGMSVASSDALALAGLELPHLSPSLRARLQGIFPRLVGTILRNPIDLGASPVRLGETLELLSTEGDFDLILFWLPIWQLLELGECWAEEWKKAVDILIEFNKQGKVPLAGIMPPGTMNEVGTKLLYEFQQAGIAVFPSLDSGSKALSHLISYYEGREQGK